MTSLIDSRAPMRTNPLRPLRPAPGPAGAAGVPALDAVPGGREAARERRPRLLAPAAAWARRHAVSIPIVLALLVIGGAVLATGIARYPAFGDDEGTYVAQAWALLSHGSLSHYTYWYDHPPLGWIQLALISWVAHPLLSLGSALSAARWVMLVPDLASIALLYVLARRIGLRRGFACLAVLLFACSPLSVEMLRQVYLDNFAMPWLLAAFALACSPSKRLWAFAGSGACFAAAVLSKETMLIFFPALVLALRHTVDRRTRAFCFAAFLAAFVLIGAGYPLYAVLKGELLSGHGHVSLADAVRWQLWGRPGTGGLLSSGSASHRLAESWLQADSWLLGLGVVLIPLGLLLRRLRPYALAVLIAVLAALRGGYLPQPFIICLLPFCALLIAGSIDSLHGSPLRIGGRRWAGPAVALAATAALLVLVAPAWRRGDAYAMGASRTAPVVASERWVEAHVDHRARILIDDTMYVDLVRGGFAQQFGAVWFYKLDFTTNLDPSILRHLPRGWREFDYVISTPVVRSALAETPGAYQQVRLALANSRVLASFGSGAQRVEVRRVVGAGVGSGLIPSAPAGQRR